MSSLTLGKINGTNAASLSIDLVPSQFVTHIPKNAIYVLESKSYSSYTDSLTCNDQIRAKRDGVCPLFSCNRRAELISDATLVLCPNSLTMYKA